MKFLQLLFFFNVLTINALEIKNSTFSVFSRVDDTLTDPKEITLNKLIDKGISEYSDYKYNKAIDTWKQVLQKADPKKDSSTIIKTNINIGSGYNALGYHKTALSYFLKTAKIFDNYRIKNEPYWTNNLNIGVCYMSLEQFDLAKKYFEKTADYSPYIVFLKKLNLAKWHALTNQQSVFISYQKDISQRVTSFPMYVDIWHEMQLDFFFKWENSTKAKELLDQLVPLYEQQNLFLKLLINQVYLLVYKKTYAPLSSIHAFAPEVISSNDLYLTSLYYSVLKEQYYALKDLENYHYYSGLWDSNNEALNEEKNMLHVEDYKAADELEELKGRFSEVQLKNQVIENQLAKSTIRFRLSVVIILMGLGIIFLLVRNYKKNRALHTLSAIQTQNELLKKELEKGALSESLKETSEELTASILNVKKVALLKKQLENIVDEKNPEYNEKETLKKLKLCLNSFFDNYRELTQMMQKKLNVDKMLFYVRKEHPEITDKDICVIEYIALHFTTKEIALLMGKSEKSIEYYRSQIRKKLQLQSDSTLEEYLNALVNR
jgi:tetratricopeptide (TPR) repeat protein